MSVKDSILKQRAATRSATPLSASSMMLGSFTRNEKYTWYSQYEDDNLSYIDKDKNITVHKSQVNITQEENSQFIPFEMDRYWDGIDLNEMALQIHLVNKDKDDYYSNPVNVCYSADKLRFAWLVDSYVTAVAGDVDFEIIAMGSNEKGDTYKWLTKPNGKINILKSLSGKGLVKPSDDWYTTFVREMDGKVAKAAEYASQAQGLVNQASQSIAEANQVIAGAQASITGQVMDAVNEKLLGVYTKEEVDALFSNQDFTAVLEEVQKQIDSIDGLAALNITYNPETNRLTFLNNETLIKEITLNTDPSAAWTGSFKTAVSTQIDEKVKAVDDNLRAYQASTDGTLADVRAKAGEIDGVKKDLSDHYYTKTEADGLLDAKASIADISDVQNSIKLMRSDLDASDGRVSALDASVAAAEDKIKELGSFQSNEYEATYEDSVFSLLENGEVKNQFTITGGSGGGSETSRIIIERITPDYLPVIYGSPVSIDYKFTSVDSAGDDTGTGTATWYVGNNKKATSMALQGSNSFDITPYLISGVNTVKLSIADSMGSISTKKWTVNAIRLYAETSFDDSLVYDSDITFRYTPYGDIEKTVHFLLDGKEIAIDQVNTTGRQQTVTLPKQKHGSHLLEVYLTAAVDSKEIRSESLYRDILWIEEGNHTPVIGSHYSAKSCKQYSTASIPYVVYSPASLISDITLSVDGEALAALTVDRTRQVWSYKPTSAGEKVLEITCGSTVKSFALTVEEIGIDISPVTTGLVFDYNPSGRSNHDHGFDQWEQNGITMAVSDNFDWAGGGYRQDDNGDTFFCIKAGTTATWNYHLFADDARKTGKEFKFIYRSANVRDYDAQVLSCYSDSIGLEVHAQQASMASEQSSISVPYCEDTYIELELNIMPDSEHTFMEMWLDGVQGKVELYSANDNFAQSESVPITVGSKDCDVWVYRMKAYENNLSNQEILDNFIADAPDADEMVSRYMRSQIYDEKGNISPEKVASVCPDLRVITIAAERMTTSKKDSVPCSVTHIYQSGGDGHCFRCENAVMKVQGTSSAAYGEAGYNLDIDLSSGELVFDDNTTAHAYAMTENSIPVDYFNLKVNIASSENANNTVLADDYNTFQPYIRPVRQADPRIRDTVEGHPCVIFFHNTSDGTQIMYACGDMNNSKKNYEVFGHDPENPDHCCIEFSNNTSNQCLWKSDDLTAERFDGSGNFEFRYPKTPLDRNIEAFQRVLSWVAGTDASAATGEPLAAPAEYGSISYTADTAEYRNAKFVHEIGDYFIVDSVTYHYLFTERHTMVDNRAKNVFIATDDGLHWYFNFDYDNDTADGNNNEGDLVLSYGMEDTDAIGTKSVFNASDSVLWANVRGLLPDRLREMFIDRENAGAWDAKRILKKFDDYQSVKPEALWIADMAQKYYRPYLTGGTTAYLTMMYGKKTHQRKQFETYQEKYMSSKYLGSVCTSDALTYRGYTPEVWEGIKPNSDLTVTPYADMYINIKYGSQSVRQRAKRGQACLMKCPLDTTNDTEIYTYTASMIRSIGDISALYVGYCNLTPGRKLQEVIIGSSLPGYENTNLIELGISGNLLLTKLDIQNCPNLKQALSLTQCTELKEFYAEGSGITGVAFAPGGKVVSAHLPDVSSLSAKGLNYLKDLSLEGCANMTTLVLENCPAIDELELLGKAVNLNRVRLTSVDWQLDDTTLTDRLLTLHGIDDNGYNTEVSVLTGHIHVPVMRQQKLYAYQAAWPNLDFAYDTLVQQFQVTFVNEDGSVLDVQYVDKGGDAADPLTRDENPIPFPQKESTVSTDFTFTGWDSGLQAVFADRTIKAVYRESLRSYTVRYLSKGTVVQTSRAEYGTNVAYSGDIPVYTAEEAAFVYYLFTGWDKSGFVDGDKDIQAVFDTCTYNEGYFYGKDIGSLRPVEIYAMMQLGLESDCVAIKDPITITLGNDYSSQDIKEKVLIQEKTVFDGTNYVDTGVALFDEDRDFVLAIDYEFLSGNETNVVLAQCYRSNGTDGFKLWHNNGPKFSWSTSTSSPASDGRREMVVLRHKKGENALKVYHSNLGNPEIETVELNRARPTLAPSTLVFGCAKADDGAYENYAKGIISWAKVWYADLGDKACENLAVWTHERIRLEMCGFKRYYLSDNSSRRCSMTFLASHLLDRTRPLNTISTNEGGWAKSALNTFLNTRMYQALPIQWKQLVKEVKVSSSVGGKSNEISTSDCYLTIPAAIEVEPAMSVEPYIYEGSPIPYMATNISRIRSFDGGEAFSYWLRSPNVTSAGYFNKVTEEGDVYGYYYPQYADGVLIELSI